MNTIDVFINGEKVCRAGIKEHGTCHAGIAMHNLITEKGENILGTNVRIGGIWRDPGGSKDGSHVNWVKRDLVPGDEIILRIVASEEMDEPEVRPPLSPATAAEQQSMQKLLKLFHERYKRSNNPE